MLAFSRIFRCPRSALCGPSVSAVAYVLLFSLALQMALPAHAGGFPGAAPGTELAAAGPDRGGPSVSAFRSAFSGHALRQVDPILFQEYVAAHPGGRLLMGSSLAAAVAAARPDSSRGPDSSAQAPRALRDLQARDSAQAAEEAAIPDTVIVDGASDRAQAADHASVDDGEAKGWFVNVFADWNDKGRGGDGGSGHDLAAIIFVVVGVVVVGAFILYGVQTLFELATDREGYPLFQELGLRLSYSGEAWKDPQGNADLYRDAYLTGIRYAIGFDRPGMGMGLSVEGGYLDLSLKGISDPSKSFDFRGGYLVAGPLLRFGRNDPLSFSLEFLNGTSTHAAVGWISKSRMTVQTKVGPHALLGAHLGAIFYDLHFLDGLAWRQGEFNRDVSLVYGLDGGWEF